MGQLSWIVTSFAGAFAFGFISKFSWGKIVEKFGPSPIGGFICAGFLVGTFWILNHHFGLIVQTGSNVWVDQGIPIACAFLFADIYRKRFNIGSAKGLLTAIAGGVLAGFVLSLM